MPETPEPADRDAIRQLRADLAVVATDAQAARTLAAGADRDVSEVRAELRAHTRVLNALRETQAEQGRTIAELRAGLADLRVEMRAGFAALASGMGDITRLLQRRDDG
jgi:septal ring factor EnvC (AmiA/AmiB activator)